MEKDSWNEAYRCGITYYLMMFFFSALHVVDITFFFFFNCNRWKAWWYNCDCWSGCKFMRFVNLHDLIIHKENKVPIVEITRAVVALSIPWPLDFGVALRNKDLFIEVLLLCHWGCGSCIEKRCFMKHALKIIFSFIITCYAKEFSLAR